MLDETYEVDGNTYQLYRFAKTVPVGDGIVFAVEGITTSDTVDSATAARGRLGQCGSGGPDRIKSGRRDAES